MSDIGIGDILFVILVLATTHGILAWVQSLKNKGDDQPEIKEEEGGS